MISVQNLVKRYGDLEVLKGISLDVQPGQVGAIIGPSGGGKSTFLRCINGLEPFDDGEIVVDELRLGPAHRGRPHPALLQTVRRRVGMVFQQFNLFPHLSVLGNLIEAPMNVLGESRQSASERAEAILERMGLRDKLHAMPRHLSGGQQQRVAIARAMAAEPAVILADEPTANLDSKSAEDLLELMRRLNEEKGTTFVISSHDTLVISHARRVVRLRDGRLEADERQEQ
jgi:polar amino acid transport system ATP-binding protein